MTARRFLAGVALLLAACTTAACAQVVSGSGTIAADVPTGGGELTGAPTVSGSVPAPTRTSSSNSPSSSDSDDDASNRVCQALDRSAVEDLFGTEVSFGRSSTSGCQIRADDGRSMIVAVFEYLKLSEYKKSGSTKLTVAGNPAVKTSSTIIYVARGSDPDAAGLIAAYFAGLRDGGEAVATKVLELVVPKFPK